jgi:hypothetical protein
VASIAELAVQAGVGLLAAGVGAGATVWAAMRTLNEAAANDRRQRQAAELERRDAALAAAANNLDMWVEMIRSNRFDTEAAFVPLPRRALDDLFQHLHTLPHDAIVAVQAAAAHVAVYNAYAEASLSRGEKVAWADGSETARAAVPVMRQAATELRALLSSAKAPVAE